MKKLFGIAGVVLFIGTSLSLNAQTNRVNSSETPSQTETGGAIATVSPKFAKAERDFNKTYKNASGVQWFNGYGGSSVVYFTEDNIKAKTVYNKKGNWEYTIRNYSASEISAEAKSMIKSEFSDYSIIHGVEVERFDKKVLLVYIQNDRRLKTARIMDGEIDIVEEYRKSR